MPSAQDRLELAARAAWLYYIAGRTQDEIAEQMDISRQAAQRLVSLAVAEKLIKFRLDHPIAACMDLAEQLRERYGLALCEVVPRDPLSPDPLKGIAVAGAQFLERLLEQRAPLVLGLSTGRTLRAVVAEVSPMETPQHKVFSMCGTMSAAGRASSLEPITRLSERTGAQCFPMPTPVIAASLDEKEVLESQRAVIHLRELAGEARALLVGISQIGWMSPLHADGFISDSELSELIEAGAVGEIAAHSFDARGRTTRCGPERRSTGLDITDYKAALRVAIGGSDAKVPAFRAALAGRRVNGIITDERTASSILARTDA